MLKKLFMAIVAIMAMFIFSGCMQGDTVVKVKSDGSGTIEKTVLLRKDMLGMIKSMSMLSKGQGEPQQEFKFFDEAKLKADASSNGEGVVYVSGEEISTDKFEGYKAVYAFTDINKVSIDQNPNSDTPKGQKDNAPKEHLSFRFVDGKENPSKLVVFGTGKRKNGNGSSNTKIQPNISSPESMKVLEQIKTMIDGMRLSLSVEVDGEITNTNATYRDGSEVTLMEMDFGRLMDNPEVLMELGSHDEMTMAETKEMLKDIKGMKVDTNEEVIILFK